ncbi:MAG: hypothetical protein LBC84_02335 [Prevotellaceae bacterium]|jgi:hypothetical protein|nr:hypothetical protein [Prevotellaceae bacterium]
MITRDDIEKQVIDSANRTFNKRESFNQQILILSATILGIFVAFQDKHSEYMCIRLLFVSTIILFALGILMLSLTLFSNVKLAYRTYYELREEAGKFMNGLPFCTIVDGGGIKKSTKCCEKFAYVFLIMGLVALVIYAVVSAFQY